MSRPARILELTAQLITEGVEPCAAIERACAKVSTTDANRDMARRIFLRMYVNARKDKAA